MNTIKTILIADRNPRILAYLKRELSKEGYCVHTAENCRELSHLASKQTCDLFIIDPDLSSDGNLSEIQAVCWSTAPRPIIVHGLSSDDLPDWYESKLMRFVRKSGTSIEQLKEAIRKTTLSLLEDNRQIQ